MKKKNTMTIIIIQNNSAIKDAPSNLSTLLSVKHCTIFHLSISITSVK